MNPSETYVRMVAENFGAKAPLAYELVAKHGASMELSSHPANGTQQMGQCFANAYWFAETSGLLYCEGWACAGSIPIAIEHAWCLDPATGKVIDPTWKDGHSYFGVAFKQKAVASIMLDTGMHGVLSNLFLLRLDVGATRARISEAVHSLSSPS